MGGHKFRLGQEAIFHGTLPGSRDRACTIVRLLPENRAGEFEYRIKVADERNERVANESDLRPAARAKPPIAWQ